MWRASGVSVSCWCRVRGWPSKAIRNGGSIGNGVGAPIGSVALTGVDADSNSKSFALPPVASSSKLSMLLLLLIRPSLLLLLLCVRPLEGMLNCELNCDVCW